MARAGWNPRLIIELLSNTADEMIAGVESPAIQMAMKFTAHQKRDTDRAFVNTMPGFSMRDLVDGEGIRGEVRESVRRNVNLITSIPKNRLADVATLIENNIIDANLPNETPAESIKKLLKKELFADDKKAMTRAKLIARDQSSKLNSNITQERFKQTGIKYYQWRAQGGSSGDGRTRDEHKARHGLLFAVDLGYTPQVEKVNGRRQKVHGVFENISGEARKVDFGHPGEGIQCRCTMNPVIE
jgi:SPP1 gp7 family putative phage head morphogenesis protein